MVGWNEGRGLSVAFYSVFFSSVFFAPTSVLQVGETDHAKKDISKKNRRMTHVWTVGLASRTI